MTVNVHTVTVEDVLNRLPMAQGSVTETSKGLNTGMIESFIKTAAGILNALLNRAGASPDTLGADEIELLREGIISYAESRCLVARDYSEDKINRAYRQWEEIRKTIRDYPGDLGQAVSAGARIVSNVNTSDPTVKRWGSGYTGM